MNVSVQSTADAACQFQQNVERSRWEPHRLARSWTQDQRQMDVPVIYLGDDELLTPRSYLEMVRRISDWMILSPHMLYDFDNPNQAYLMDVIAGKLRIEDYEVMDRLFGEQGAIDTRDNHFFHAPKAAFMGKILSHAFQFTVKNVNTAFAEKQIKETSRAGAKMLTQALLEAAGSERGINLNFARDKNIPLPKDGADLLRYMNGQEQVESICYKLLEHTDYQYSFQNMLRKAFDNKYDINAEFAYMKVVKGEVIPTHYHPDQVRYIATRRVENFEDPNVLAMAVQDYMSPTELINEFGLQLQTGTGIQGIINYFDKLARSGRNRIGYDRNGNYWTDEGIAGWGLGSTLNDLSIQGYSYQQINWMNQLFYPAVRGIQGLLMNILVQRGYFRVVRHKRFKVQRFENGSSRPATDKELEHWRSKNYDRSIDLRFIPVDETAKENLTRQNVKSFPRTELHQYTRIGHDSFINVGRYEYEADPDGEMQGYTGSPIVAQISYKKSMAKLGERDAIRVNVLHRLIDEYLANMGFTEGIIVDDAQGVEPIEYLYNFRKSGVARMDSTLMQPNNAAQLRHLQTIRVSNHTEELQAAFAMIRQIETTYQSKIGLSPQTQGVSEKYDGLRETQLNITNQQLLLTETIYEHTQFANQCLQRAADILKRLYAYDGSKLIVLSDHERELLTLTAKLALADFDVRLESGQIIEDELAMIKRIAETLAASGGASESEAMIDLGLTRSKAEARAIVRKMSERLEKAAAAQQEQAMAIAQQNAEVEREKLTNRLEVEKEITRRDITVARMKLQGAADQQDATGQLSDIQESNAREKMMLQAGLDAQQQAAEAEQPTTAG